MDDINKQIEEMADKMEKSTTSPNEKLFAVIKSLGKDGLKAKLATLSDDEKGLLKAALEEMSLKKAISFDDQYQAKFVQGNIMDTKIQEDKADDDQDEKLVKPAAAKMAHQGTPTDGWEGQVIKSLEDNIDQVIEKAMEKCNDDKMVMKKLKEKGMDEKKVQGALDKYKQKKDMKKSEADDLEKGKMKEREQAKEKIMQMEEKEHGTKDPKKLVSDEKKEHAMKKGELPEKANPEVDQVGDAPEMKDGKQMAKKTAAPDIEALGKDNKKNMTKSLTWEDETRLLKANTQGRNFTFNVEQFITETLANEPKENVTKSQGKEDLNDLIQKGADKTWNQVNTETHAQESQKKQNGSLVKSFSDEDLRTAMGLSEEDYKKMME